MEQFLEKNQNPVISVGNDGMVLYSNEAGVPLLHEWGVEIGEKLPSTIAKIVQQVISRNNPEKIKFNVGKRVYLVVFYPLTEQECVNLCGFNISDQKELEEKPQGSGDREIANLELADIIDTQVIQSLMDDFYKLAHIPMSLDDLKGNVLVGVGWQDICTKFHRTNPETCKHCIESDTKLSKGISLGEFKLYKCKNNMWDIATPIIVGGQHVGNIFSGQFFFEDEALDYELFRSHARKFGFNEEEYIKALEKVPRLSREAVDTGMSFLMTFANMVSQLGYSNLKLSQSLAERDTLVSALQKNQEDLGLAQAVGNLGSWRLNVCKNELTWSDEAHRIFGIPKGTPLTYETFLSTVHVDDKEYVDKKWKAALAGEPYDIEHRIIVDCKVKWVREKAYLEFDNDGTLLGGFGITQGITERKRAEDALRLSNLYNRSLIEASLDPLVTIGHDGKITDVNSATEQVTGHPRNDLIGTDFSDYFTKAEKARKGYQQVFVHGEVRDYPLEIRHKDGYITPVLYNASVYRDENGKVIGVFAAARDITEQKRAEEALREGEERYRAFFNTSAVGTVEIDLTGRITKVNDRYCQITGYSREELLGMNVAELSHPDDRNYDRKLLTDYLSGRTSTLNVEKRYILKNSRMIWVQTAAAIVYDTDGRPIRSSAVVQDITERKQAEAKLKETLGSLEARVKERTAALQKAYDSLKQSENSLAEAQRMTHIGNWDCNLVTGEVYWSDETYRIFGLKPQESKLNYDTFLSYMHPDDRDRITNAVNEALKGKPFDVDYRIIQANGEERTAHEKAEVIFDDNKNPIRIRGTTQDITEHWKAAERILNLANVVESSTEAIITKSFEGIITSWNKGAEQVYGYSAEEILGKSISILEPLKLTGETERLSETIKRGEKVHQYETLRLRKDGKVITISLTIFPVYDNQGKITAASIISTDITRRKEAEEKLRESEEKYRNIVETANELILITDNENVITYVNKRIEDMLGYTTEEFIGRPVWGFISEKHIPIVKKSLIKRRQGISGSYELKLIRKDGSSLWTLLNAKPLFDKEGKYVGAMSMLTDITERKKAEEDLAEFEITRQKEIHHRIKNNLQVISSLLDLQAEKFNDMKVIEAFRESQDRVISMALIHEELYKGDQTNTLEFSTYIKELAENLFHTYSLKSKNIHLDLDLEENAFFDMDTAVPLGIIVNELVSNSLKHAFQGRDKGEIRIKLHREEGECEREGSKSASYTLNVSDNGVGIPEGFNLEDTDSLGLQLVTALVDQLDGQLELKRNNGAELAIRFTVKEDK